MELNERRAEINVISIEEYLKKQKNNYQENAKRGSAVSLMPSEMNRFQWLFVSIFS